MTSVEFIVSRKMLSARLCLKAEKRVESLFYIHLGIKLLMLSTSYLDNDLLLHDSTICIGQLSVVNS